MKRIISAMLVIVALFAFTSVAFASTGPANWSSGTCRHRFITSNYVERTGGNRWTYFSISLDSCTHTPDNPGAGYINGARVSPVTANGNWIADSCLIYANGIPGLFGNFTEYRVHVLVENPNYNTSNPTNMASSGGFGGVDNLK